MTLTLSHQSLDLVRRALADALVDGINDEAAPVRAGIRARAVATLCDRLDLPAVLIDGTGRVLHVGAAASRLIPARFDVSAEHLVGRTRDDNRRIAGAVTAVLGGRTYGLVSRASADELIGFPYRDVSPSQILKGVLVLNEGSAGEEARSLALQLLLPA